MRFFQLLLSFVFVMSSVVLNAQCKEVNRSLKAMNNNDIDSSISSLKIAEEKIIENGLETVSSVCLARFYFAKGACGLLKGKREDSLGIKLVHYSESAENYKKYLKLPERPSDLEDIVKSNVLSLGIELINVGVGFYETQKYDQALVFTEMGIELKSTVDSSAVNDQERFNAMVCAKMIKQYEKAFGYAGSLLTSEKLTKVNEIRYLSQKVEVLTLMDSTDKALETLQLLKKRKPSDPNVKLTELQLYLNKGQSDSALVLLDGLTANYPKREDLWVIKGQLHFGLKQIGKSISSFNAVINLNSKNVSALYGLGVIHVNRANEYVKKQITENDKEKKDELNAFAKTDFERAASYLNRIIDLDPGNRNSLEALKDIYNNTGDVENGKRIDSLLRKL